MHFERKAMSALLNVTVAPNFTAAASAPSSLSPGPPAWAVALVCTSFAVVSLFVVGLAVVRCRQERTSLHSPLVSATSSASSLSDAGGDDASSVEEAPVTVIRSSWVTPATVPEQSDEATAT